MGVTNRCDLGTENYPMILFSFIDWFFFFFFFFPSCEIMGIFPSGKIWVFMDLGCFLVKFN